MPEHGSLSWWQFQALWGVVGLQSRMVLLGPSADSHQLCPWVAQ